MSYDEFRKIVDVRDTATLTLDYVTSDSFLCLEYDFFTLLIDYERAVAAGAVTFKVEYSLDDTIWYQGTLYKDGGVVVNNDTESNIQREEITYGGTANEQEFFTSGVVEIDQFAKYMRISVMESGGGQGEEGDCGIKCVLTRRKQKMIN